MAGASAAVGHSIPFAATEYGFTSGSIGELDEALGNVRESIILIGEGFKFALTFYTADFWTSSPTELGNTYGYYWNLDPAIIFGTDKIGPKPAVPAYAAMTYLLDGATTSGPVSGLTGTQMGYRFANGGNNIVVLWDYQNPSTASLATSPSQSLQVCDWMGNCQTTVSSGSGISLTLGAEPTYIVGSGI
jgi:hypothetical protein